MALINICGFETGDSIEGTLSGTASIQSSVKRTGTYALRANPTTTGTGYFQFQGLSTTTGATSATGITNFYARFYFRFDTAPASGSEEIFTAQNNATIKFALRLTSAGKLAAYQSGGTTQLGSDGATTLSSGTWYRIEVLAGNGASASYEVRINGVTEFSGTGNLSAVNTTLSRYGKVNNRSSQSVDFYYDDIAIDDAAFPGPGAVGIMLPDGNGNATAWTGTYTDVDEVPHDGDTSYLTSTLVIGDAETVTLQSAAAAGITGTVKTVKRCAIVTRDGASDGAVRIRLRSNTTNSDTISNATTTTGYALLSALASTDPATGAAWVLSALDSVEVGVVERSNANRSRCTALYAMVEFEAAGSSFVPRRRRMVIGL